MIWIGLLVLLIGLLSFDLFILHEKGKIISYKKAAVETSFWISIAALFSFAVYLIYSNELVENPENLEPMDAVIMYITGYLIELSLSVDNLFVMAMIFGTFNIPLKYQHTTLFYGILGAIIFRGIMIGIGVALINAISWMTYVFGAFLIFTALKMLFTKEHHEDEKKQPWVYKLFKVSPTLTEERFFTIENGVRMATPLFAALVMIELTDILFALDSVPAILAVTTDPFIVYSSNIFAILGLRAMYFFLANMLDKFVYLKYSVFAILIFVGIKILLIHHIHFPEWLSLGFIAVALGLGVLVSLQHLRDRERAIQERSQDSVDHKTH